MSMAVWARDKFKQAGQRRPNSREGFRQQKQQTSRQKKKKKHVPRNLLSACYLLLAAVKHSNGGYCFQSRDGFLF